MQNSIYKMKYLLFLSWDWEAWCLTVWGVITPSEWKTAWNKGRKCLHCLGAPNNLIRTCSYYIRRHTDRAVGNILLDCIKCYNFSLKLQGRNLLLLIACLCVRSLCRVRIVGYSCTQRQTSKESCKLGKAEIFRELDDEWCWTCLRVTVRTVRLKLLTGPLRLGKLLYLQTWSLECNFEVEKWEALEAMILR